jgi:hypothetical protein
VGNQPPRTENRLTCPTSYAAPADQSNHQHNPSLSGPIDEKTYMPVAPLLAMTVSKSTWLIEI